MCNLKLLLHSCFSTSSLYLSWAAASGFHSFLYYPTLLTTTCAGAVRASSNNRALLAPISAVSIFVINAHFPPLNVSVCDSDGATLGQHGVFVTFISRWPLKEVNGYKAEIIDECVSGKLKQNSKTNGEVEPTKRGNSEMNLSPNAKRCKKRKGAISKCLYLRLEMADCQARKSVQAHNSLCSAVLSLLVFTACSFSPLALLLQQPNFPAGINKLSCYPGVRYTQASMRKWEFISPPVK